MKLSTSKKFLRRQILQIKETGKYVIKREEIPFDNSLKFNDR
ncbi:hypothetical protein [Methanobacterium paludis]|uniref:Uncharacterized protein n=1 Tax=Methanobacterium paludis (strain DSM 25820 / JCM 18151 / SWAN1) TaxID=868131 RepID=F6D295_METPW|nr:hypothetical protein [Methanobacterium paludis]AEG18612.1 hypothetical protein MSWAN_1601 [Methanobacterium paludis]